MRFVLFPLALLALAGCSSVMDLSPMPQGYSYYHEPYKSQPPKEVPGIGYPWSPERNAVVLEKWQEIAKVLADRLETQLNIRPRPVYLEMLERDNAFNYSFDYVMRQELQNRGYMLVSQPKHELILRPEAYLPEDESISFEIGSFNGEEDRAVPQAHPERAQQFLISLTLLRDDDVLGKVEDSFMLPAYGYIPGEGQQKRSERMYNAPRYVAPRTESEPASDALGMPEQLVPEAVESEIIGGTP
jgi:hypothetical protein